MKRPRVPSRQFRRLNAPKPPLGVADAYQALIANWLERRQEAILRVISKDWHKNPRAFSGRVTEHNAGRKDAATGFIHKVLEDIDIELVETFSPEALAGDLAIFAARVNKKGLLEFQRTIGISVRDPSLGVGHLLDAWRTKNVDLITSLAGKQLDTITDTLGEAEAGAWRVEELRGKLQEDFGVTKSKADLLARDQTLKLNGQITKQRQTNAGISRYIWTSSGDERVRPMHDELDGTMQTWGDPPVTSEDGATNEPGQDYQCRCTAFPVLDELVDETAEDG